MKKGPRRAVRRGIRLRLLGPVGVVALVLGLAAPQQASAAGLAAAPRSPATAAATSRPVIAPAAPIKPRKLDMDAVPRREAVPAGRPMPPATRVRELVGRRSATASFFQLSDGRVQAEVSATPVHYRDSHGDWQPIDATIRPSARAGFRYGNEANTFGSLFGGRSDALARLEQGGRHVTLGLPGPARTASAQVRGDSITYPRLLGPADVTYQVTPEELKERIVLAGPATDPTYTFTLDPGGLTAAQRPDGTIAFFRPDGDGPPLLVMPRPYMTDAAADRSAPYGKVWSDKVSQTLARVGSRLQVTVRADAGWIADPGRKFPVVIDPTIKIQPTVSQSQDAMILSDSGASNFDGSWRLSVGTTTTGVARSLLKFPLTNVPAGTTLDSAQLKVYFDQTHTADGYDVPIEAHRATAAWDESTVTWNSASGNVGELGVNQETVDDGDAGKTAVSGSWPYSTNTALTQYAVNGDYAYNKDAATGDTYTWVPRLTEDGSYRVEAHYVPASDRATAAPYTVYYSGGQQTVNVNQTLGSGGVWTTLATKPFTAGTTSKVVLGDVADSTKAVIADAVRLTKDGTAVKKVNESNVWHTFSVRSTVQSWLDGSQPNYGFVLKAADEATLGRGGPRYEAAEYAYNGEVENTPKLVLTWGRPSVNLAAPTVIHATGAELHWSGYVDPSSSTADDLVEYQVHRSIYQNFAPSAATLVAPVAAGTLSYTDTTATPTPADSTDPFGNAYYYMVAVKTRDGQVIPGQTQLVRLPKAGRVVQIFQGSAPDTTLSSAQPDANLNSLGGDPWLEVGDNSGTYGKARAVVKFPDLSTVPSTARVLDSYLTLWGFTTFGSGATYELHALNRDFDQATATWNKANSTTAWTTPGGDYNPTVSDTVSGVTNDPARREWTATGIVQGWVATPASNHGLEVKLANETSPAERTLFLSSEAAEPRLRPKLVVTYIEKTTDSTYYAPYTPARMIPGDQYTVAVTLTNTTTTTWPAASRVLSYHWALPDGTDATTSGNRLETALPKDLVPGDTVTVNATVKTPIQSGSGNKREQYVLTWDLLDKSTGQFLSQSDGIPGLAQNVAVEDPTSDQIGLEKFYQYAGRNTGAGSTVMDNEFAGNMVFSYNPLSNPSRGLSTFVRVTYNSLDTSNSAMGFGWSLSTSSVMRLGTALDLHPPGQDWPTDITLTDGDGTSHLFTLNKHGSTDPTVWDYDHPAGVHLYLQKTGSSDTTRAWVMTRPDRTQLFFDSDGYQSALVDNDGNQLLFTYEQRKSNNKPIKFLRYLTDPAGRQTLTLSYYAKGDAYTYIDDTGAEISATNLTNPKIIDQVKTITDISGRQLSFTYTTQGLMAKLVDGAGSTLAKTFRFSYDMTQGNKNVKLVAVTDPRGHTTNLAYYSLPTDDPHFHWWGKTITDRNGGVTSFAYTDPDGSAGSQIQTVVTDPENHASTYLMDGYGRPEQLTNAKGQVTKLHFDADNNVDRLEENNGAATTWTFDPNTGYPLSMKDAEANKNGTAAATYTYQTGLTGHVADLIGKASPEGRTWAFGYDTVGNLTSVTDPAGTATPTVGDFTTAYSYDANGQLLTAKDANGNTTSYSSYDPNGYPQTITDPLGNATKFVYDARGQVTKTTDALNHDSTQNYDVFGRPLDQKVPKDQAAGVYISTAAPVYDPNDNITQSTTPNGAVTSYVYDNADQITSSTAPKDTSTGPDRVTTYTYDKVGNVASQTEPNGNLTTGDPNDFVTRYSYDEINQLSTLVDANGGKLSYAYDDVGNVTTVVDPRKNATVDTTDYSAKYSYDLDHRVKTTTDAEGHVTSRDYDRDGTVVATTDADGNRTTLTLDARGKPVEMDAPFKSSGGTISSHTTRYEYDQVGNRTKVITPRGVATATADDFVSQTTYDALNRVKDQIAPYDPTDARYNTPDKTSYTYDAAGRLAKVSAPPSAGQTLRNDTTSTYWDNGWTKTSTDPWYITTSFDYNPLGRQTSRTITSAGGSSSRTMSWDYYPDGKLKSRSDDGVPVGLQVALVDNSDAQNVSTVGTWPTSSSGSGFQGYNYATHAAGTGTNSLAWNLVIPQDGNYTVYVKYPAVAGAATNAPYKVDFSGGSATKTVSQATGAGTWVSLGKFAFSATGTGQKVTLTDNANGTVAADAVKLVRDNSADTDNEKKVFAYGYDANGNQTQITDSSPGARFDTYAVAYDGLNRLVKVEEKAAGVTKHTTSYGYDEDGNPISRGHDAETATFEYDVRNLLSKVTNAESSSDPKPKVTTFSYDNRALMQRQTKANGNTVDYSYFLDGSLQHQIEKKSNGTLVSEHTFDYDPNGNTIKDTQTRMNADNHAATINRVLDYTYDPRDRLTSLKKTDPGTGAVVESETYVRDANNNVISQTVGGTTTNSTYDRNRLQSAVIGGANASYNYDPFGRLDTVSVSGQVTEKYGYDGFDHLASDRKTLPTASTTTFAYDPFDRTVTRTANAGAANEKTTTYNYLGLTGNVVSEEVAGAVTKTYQYGPAAQRLSQVKINSDGTKENSYYSYSPHSDVEAVTDDNGDTKATYGYTAYGSNDGQEFSGVDKPDPADPTKEPYNAYRYNAKRWDPATGNYDMGFREYNPGLNRFLTRDMYNGALADMRLSTDPFTGNRYDFGGGNPISAIELDGHCWSWLQSACDAVGTAWNATTSAVSSAWDTTTSALSSAWDATTSALSSAWNATTHAVSTAASTTVHAVSTAASTTVHAVSTAANSTAHWVSEHKAEIAGIAAGIAVGVACEAITAGAGTIGCLALSGAVGSMVTYGLSTPAANQSIGGYLMAGLVGGATGALFGVAGRAISGALAPAAEDAVGGGMTQLFRHVNPQELADIQTTGVFRAGGSSMTGKFFAETGEHAQQWGNILNGGRGAVVETRVPTSFADQLMRWDKLDGIGPARYVDESQLDMFNRLMDGIRQWTG